MILFTIFITKKHERFSALSNKENIVRVVKIEKVRRWVRATTVYMHAIHHDKQNTYGKVNVCCICSYTRY